jgi:hypothetical protein
MFPAPMADTTSHRAGKTDAATRLHPAGLLQDALALPIFAGGNMGVRRRGLHAMLANPGYDPLAALDRS